MDYQGSPHSSVRGVAANNTHISSDFVNDVLNGDATTDVSQLAFRDPKPFVSGNIHKHLQYWETIAKSTPCESAAMVLNWSRNGIDIHEFLQRFKGQYKGENYNSHLPLPRIFDNNASCQSFGSFISDTNTDGLATDAFSLWGKVDITRPPRLVMPLTIEALKPCLCHDNRYVN